MFTDCQIDYTKGIWSIPSSIWNAIDEHQILSRSSESDYYNGTIEKFIVSAYIGHFKYSGQDPRSYAMSKPNVIMIFEHGIYIF